MAAYGGSDAHAETLVQAAAVIQVLGASSGGSHGLGLPVVQGGPGGGASLTLMVLVSPDQEARLAFARAYADLEVAIDPISP